MVAQQLPEGAGRQTERDEHRAKARDEHRGGRDDPAGVDAGLVLQLREIEPRHHRQVAGEQREDARRQERDDAAAEGREVREQVDVADAAAEREDRGHSCPIICRTLRRRPSAPLWAIVGTTGVPGTWGAATRHRLGPDA